MVRKRSRHTDILQASQIAEQLRLNIAATACIWQPEEQNTGIEIPISASIVNVIIFTKKLLRPPSYHSTERSERVVFLCAAAVRL